jgi:hypothetical protein
MPLDSQFYNSEQRCDLTTLENDNYQMHANERNKVSIDYHARKDSLSAMVGGKTCINNRQAVQTFIEEKKT